MKLQPGSPRVDRLQDVHNTDTAHQAALKHTRDVVVQTSRLILGEREMNEKLTFGYNMKTNLRWYTEPGK